MARHVSDDPLAWEAFLFAVGVVSLVFVLLAIALGVEFPQVNFKQQFCN